MVHSWPGVRRKFAAWIVLAVLAFPDLGDAATPGDRFRAALADLKSTCASRTRPPGDKTCDFLELQPADPLATPEGRFAHSIKLPPPLDAPKAVYRPWMGSEAYFKALCKAEAGEFIFSTIHDVEGVLQMRPRRPAASGMLKHLYALEDPYGHEDWKVARPHFILVGPGRYQFFEQLLPGAQSWERVIRHEGYDARNLVTMKTARDVPRRSKYGFTWRGISRSNDRELGIAGGDQIILDLEARAVIAVKRGFIRSGDFHVSPGVWWPAAHVCPGESKNPFATRDFINKVLSPAKP
jgi:hypothetical protein